MTENISNPINYEQAGKLEHEMGQAMHDATAILERLKKKEAEGFTASDVKEQLTKVDEHLGGCLKKFDQVLGIKVDYDKMKKDIEDMQQRMEEAERIASRKSSVGANGESIEMIDQKGLHRKSYVEYMTAPEGISVQQMSPDVMKFYGGSIASLPDFYKKYLRTDNLVDGGFLCPPDVTRDLLKEVTEVSNIRRYATVRTTNRKDYPIRTRTKLLDAFWQGEGQNFQLSQSNYGKEVIDPKKMGVLVRITTELLQDSMFDMETEINSDVGERFEQFEGLAFVIGNGVLQPEGLLTNEQIKSTEAEVAGELNFDDIKQVRAKLKVPYRRNHYYTFNSETEIYLSKLKDEHGKYLWQAGNIAGGIPNTIDNVPYFLTQDMPNIVNAESTSSDTFPILYGDFKKTYMIVDRQGVTVIRDPYSQKVGGFVEFLFQRRVGAQVVMAEAMRKIKVLGVSS